MDVIDGVPVTCIDNGMPVVVMRAADVARTGYETRDELDTDTELKARIESIRLKVGPLMNLGDVTEKTVPKMILVAPPRDGRPDLDAVVHSPSRARDHRRVRRAERRHGVSASGEPGARHRPDS
jgi:2-methylaconitate cis-trans-isomerase PrpF